MTKPTLIVFGPQGPLPRPKVLEEIRQSLISNPHLLQLQKSIKELPDLWPSIVEVDPNLSRTSGLQVLTNLSRWIETGILDAAEKSQPNVLLTPLTTITHFVQYFHQAGLNKDYVSAIVPKTHVQGFCSGLLAATAVSCSQTVAELGELACVALRLSVCIGAFVDLDGKYADPPNEASCLVVHWRSVDGAVKLSKILDEYPEVSHTLECYALFTRIHDAYSFERLIYQQQQMLTVLLSPLPSHHSNYLRRSFLARVFPPSSWIWKDDFTPQDMRKHFCL